MTPNSTITTREYTLLRLLERAIGVIDALRATDIVPRMPLVDLERIALTQALATTGGNQKAAAQLLGIHARVINYKMQIHGMSRPRDRRDTHAGAPC